MSFWNRMKMEIKDLEAFQKSCADHNIRYEENKDENLRIQGDPVVAVLHDETPGNVRYSTAAYLVQTKDGMQISMDTHVGYGSIATRLGADGGKLTRDYSVNVIEKGVLRSGGMVQSREEAPDGSVVLKISAVG